MRRTSLSVLKVTWIFAVAVVILASGPVSAQATGSDKDAAAKEKAPATGEEETDAPADTSPEAVEGVEPLAAPAPAPEPAPEQSPVADDPEAGETAPSAPPSIPSTEPEPHPLSALPPEAGAETAMSSDSEPAPVSRSGPRRNLVLLGPGLGFGCFYPKDVNDYIENWTDLQGATLESGFTAMVFNIVPKVAFSYAPIEYVQIQVVGEIGWAPKILAIAGGDTGVFHYMRYSLGGTINGHLPLKGGKLSVLIGAGGLFSWLRFESFGAATPGVRGLVGLRMFLEKLVPEVFLEFNWIKDNSDEKHLVPERVRSADGSFTDQVSYKQLEMSYTGITLGVNFYFQLFGR
jgi:hypothetical protein